MKKFFCIQLLLCFIAVGTVYAGGGSALDSNSPLFDPGPTNVNVAEGADDFVFVETVNTGAQQQHGIAYTGSMFQVTEIFSPSWREYDATWNFIRTVNANTGGSFRGIVYVNSRGTLFAGDYDSGTIYEVDFNGNVLNSFPATGINALNAIAYSGNSDTLFAVDYNGIIVELSLTGAALNTYNIGGTWTGAAFDDSRDTLLLLTSDYDTVEEYSRTLTFVRTAYNGDAVNGNGQGLAYEESTGKLWVSSQSTGEINVFQREGGSSPCTLEMNLTYTNNNLNINIDVGTSEAAGWNLWLSFMNEMIPLVSGVGLPALDPPISIPIQIPGFPSLGNIGVLTTLITADGITCSDWDTVDTGPIELSAEQAVDQLSKILDW